MIQFVVDVLGSMLGAAIGVLPFIVIVRRKLRRKELQIELLRQQAARQLKRTWG